MRFKKILFLTFASYLFAFLPYASAGGQAVKTPAKRVAFNFDSLKPGTLPQGWKAEETGQDKVAARWQVIEDPTAPSGKNVLAITAPGSSGDSFNLCWTGSVSFKDGEVSVRFRPVKGESDQGGGIMWRVQDKDNYYVVRHNPLENNLRLYFVKGGKRKMLKSASKKIPAGEWNAMRITQKGSRIEAFLNNERLIEAEDSAIPEPGGVGLWTKADALTSFDDLEIME